MDSKQPLAYDFHGIAYYDMSDFDKLPSVMPLTDIVNRLSPRFNTRHNLFWINPKTKAIESFYTFASMESKYKSLYHTDA